ncbi:MAG: ATP-binding cassette domain-containing protein [Desulfovibrio sp.]|jgi:molybdate transport system ATP-binding protein|nr:ATP-binding cassette domain-containing protein [Desulfovibrio sp.]
MKQVTRENGPRLMARLDRVYAGYNRKMVFSGLSLSLFFNEHLALIGANGAGKSTLLALLQGSLRPVQDLPDAQNPGKVFWCFTGGEDPSALTALEHARLVSPAGQRRYLKHASNLNGKDILLSGLSNSFMPYGPASEQDSLRCGNLARACEAFPLLSQPVRAMSQGELRLCLILRAVMSRTALLLLDEPFDGLDEKARRKVLLSLEVAAQDGATLVISAHRKADIPPFVAEALLVRKGGITRHSIARLPPPYGAFGPEIPPLPAGRKTPPLRFDGASIRTAGQPALLRVKNACVFIEHTPVLHNINWVIRQGEQWLVSGPNGAGKSTLLRLLYGDENAALGGSVSWRGRKRIGLEELRRHAGYVSDRLQDLYDYDLSAEDVVISGLRGSIGLYGEPVPAEAGLARVWLERMGAADLAGVPFHSLSSGNARRVILARALAGSPSVLILDEPCSGLDPEGRGRFLSILPELAARGASLIYVSHRDEPIDPLFTHELRLDKGRVIYAGRRKSRS